MPDKPGGVAAGGGAAQADRCGPAAAQRRGRRRSTAADGGGARGRGGKRDAHPRRPPVADVRLRPPCDRSRHPRAADPADHPRLRRRHHRLGLPGLAGHHGPAAGARQEQDQAGRHSVPRARARRSARRVSRRCSTPSTPPSPKAGPIPPAPRSRRRNLAEEGIWLGRLVASLLPDEPEALGLLALMLHAEARRGARRNARGEYVPLADQDPAAWNAPLIEEAEALLLARQRAWARSAATSWRRRCSRPMSFAGAPAGPTGRRSSGSTTRCSR